MSSNDIRDADQQRRLSAQNKTSPWHDVTVHWPDGTSHEDGIRGVDQADAVANAEWNWGAGNPFGQAERIEYHGLAADDGRAR